MTAGTWNENKDFIHVVLLLNYVDKQWSWCSQLPAGHAGVGIHKRTKFPNRKANVQLWWNLTKSSEQVSGQNSISVVDELDPGHNLFLYLLEQCFLFPNPISTKNLHRFHAQPCSAQAGYFGKHKTFIQTTRNFKRTLSRLLLVTETPSLASCTWNYLSLGQTGQERGDLWVSGIVFWSGRLGYKAMPLDTAFFSVALQFTTGDFS